MWVLKINTDIADDVWKRTPKNAKHIQPGERPKAAKRVIY
jgi:hypothetical protein